MKLLVTGAVQWDKDYLNQISNLGNEIIYVQDERIPLDRIELDVDNLVNLNSEDNLRNIITDHDFKKTSNANLLKNLMTLKKLHEEDFRKMKIDYTYEGHYGFE